MSSGLCSVGCERLDDPLHDRLGHFFAAAAEAMRRILIDNARRKNTQKRGAGADLVAT